MSAQNPPHSHALPEAENSSTTTRELAQLLGQGAKTGEGQVIFRRDDVHLHTSKQTTIPGSLFLIEKPSTKSVHVAWVPSSLLSDVFTLVDKLPSTTDSPGVDKSLSSSSSGSFSNSKGYVSASITNPIKNSMYAILTPVSKIQSIQWNVQKRGWSHIVLILRNGLTHPPLYFHDGGSQEFFETLNNVARLTRSREDDNVILVGDLPDEDLRKSLNHLKMQDYFNDVFKKRDVINQNKSPYWQLLELGTKVTKMVRDTKDTIFGYGNNSPIPNLPNLPPQHSRHRSDLSEISHGTRSPRKLKENLQDCIDDTTVVELRKDNLTENIQENYYSSFKKRHSSNHSISDINNNNTEANIMGFEMVRESDADISNSGVTTWRDEPLNEARWRSYFDSEGRIMNSESLKQEIFYGGVEDNIRKEVWKFLLGFYSYDSTYDERRKTRERKRKEYEVLKNQWKSITPEQERRFRKFTERKHKVEKDVVRTDRNHSKYRDDDSKYLQMLFDILVTYTFYNFDLGYCQGINDLLSPILVVMEDESDTFWCFVNVMDTMERNFSRDQNGMHTQLNQLSTIVKITEKDFYAYLETHDGLNFFFCFRWMLVLFKREFEFNDIMRLWEAIWTHHLTKNFHLFVATAILRISKPAIMQEDMQFDDILKFINDLSGKMDLDKILDVAKTVFYDFRAQVKKIESSKPRLKSSGSSEKIDPKQIVCNIGDIL